MFGSTSRKVVSIIILVLVISGVTAGCTGDNGGDNKVGGLQLATLEKMPPEVKQAPVTVQRSYQFVVANPETLKKIPCYCGCGSMGHTSNYSCYVKDEDSDGSFIFDDHALGCSICVDITQDTMRLLNQGKEIPEILAYVNQTYAKFGPSNIPYLSRYLLLIYFNEHF